MKVTKSSYQRHGHSKLSIAFALVQSVILSTDSNASFVFSLATSWVGEYAHSDGDNPLATYNLFTVETGLAQICSNDNCGYMGRAALSSHTHTYTSIQTIFLI